MLHKGSNTRTVREPLLNNDLTERRGAANGAFSVYCNDVIAFPCWVTIVMEGKRQTVDQVLDAYVGHPLSRASIFERLRRTLPANVHPTELDLAIDAEGEITDQNHVGGALSTLQLAALATIKSEHRILDLGCGLGGPARLVALVYGCRVLAIDANPQRIADATSLTELVQLSDYVHYLVDDISSLTFEQRHDIVWVQNTWQHIGRPALLASTAANALVLGGHLAFEEVVLKRIARDSKEQYLLDELCDVWRCSLVPLSEWTIAFQSGGLAIKFVREADALFLDYFVRSTAMGPAKRSDWPKHELIGTTTRLHWAKQAS